jgi:hypothetical protein
MSESGHSPATVGKHFIRNYYTVMHDDPQSLFKFYKDDSVYSHGVEMSVEKTVTGSQNINDTINSLELRNCKVVLSSLHAQQTLQGGVLLLVKGTIANDSSSRKFIQTFVLAPQQPEGYYVRNDIICFLSDESSAPASKGCNQAVEGASPAAKEKLAAGKPKEAAPAEPKPLPAKAIEPAQKQPTAAPEPAKATEQPAVPKESAPAPATPPAEEKKDAPTAAAAAAAATPVPTPATTPMVSAPLAEAAAAAPSPAVTSNGANPSPASKPSQDATSKSKGKPEAAPTSPVAPTTSKEAPKDKEAPKAAPKSEVPSETNWASIAARMKDTPVTVLPQARVTAPKKKEAVATAQEEKAPATPSASTTDEKAVLDPNSIYVSNLPFQAEPQQVLEVFKQFGKINSSSFQIQKGFAFIEYDTAETAQKLIKQTNESPIHMGKRVLKVEERKTQRSSGSERKVSNTRDKASRGPRSEKRPGSEREKTRGDKHPRTGGSGGRTAANGASAGEAGKGTGGQK